MVQEDVIGYIHTKNIGSGVLKAGYALYFTKDRLLGAHKRILGYIAAYLGEDSQLDLEYWEKAKKIHDAIDEKKDFDFNADEVNTIFLKKPGVFRTGFMTLNTKDREIKLMISDQMGAKEFNILFRLLSTFAGDKLKLVEK